MTWYARAAQSVLALATLFSWSGNALAIDGATLAWSGVFILVSSTAGAVWLVAKRKIEEKPVRILAFFAYFWVWVFVQAMGFALISALA